MTGVKPRRRKWGRAPPEGGLGTPRHPSPRGVDFQVSRETLQKINLFRMIYQDDLEGFRGFSSVPAKRLNPPQPRWDLPSENPPRAPPKQVLKPP